MLNSPKIRHTFLIRDGSTTIAIESLLLNPRNYSRLDPLSKKHQKPGFSFVGTNEVNQDLFIPTTNRAPHLSRPSIAGNQCPEPSGSTIDAMFDVCANSRTFAALDCQRRALGVISWWYLECIGLIFRRVISVGLRLADPSYHVVTAIFSNDCH
jgi:hypothetical protein